jgi:intracellular septation protein
MNPMVRLGLDIGPLIIFFVVNGRFGILPATATFMVLAIIALAVHWFSERKLPLMPLVSTGLVLVFGGLTLYFNDENFIKLKPTILYLLFATALVIGLWRGQTWVAVMFGGTVDMPDAAWRILTWRVVCLLVVQAMLNEAIWRTQTTDTWIASKLGLMALSVVFFLGQTPFLMRHDRNLSAAAKNAKADADADASDIDRSEPKP